DAGEGAGGGGGRRPTGGARGGKVPTRALRDLCGGTGRVAPVPAPPPAISRGTASVPAAPGEPLLARLIQAAQLTHHDSDKDTRHVILADESGALSYEVGDNLGVVARNDSALVVQIIERLGAKPDTPVLSTDGVERPLAEALSEFCEIRRPSDQAIEVLSSRAHDIDESRILQAMAEGYPGIGPEDADLLDLLEIFPSARPPLSELIS